MRRPISKAGSEFSSKSSEAQAWFSNDYAEHYQIVSGDLTLITSETVHSPCAMAVPSGNRIWLFVIIFKRLVLARHCCHCITLMLSGTISMVRKAMRSSWLRSLIQIQMLRLLVCSHTSFELHGANCATGCPHTAFYHKQIPTDTLPRQSIEVRALVFTNSKSSTG